MAGDSVYKDALDALAEQVEWQLPNNMAAALARAANHGEMAAALRDAIASVPSFLTWPLHAIAQRLYSRGTPASMALGTLIDLVPPIAHDMRQMAGISEADARAETARRFMTQYAAIRSTLPKLPGAPVAQTTTPHSSPTPTQTPAPPPVPASSVSRIQHNIASIADDKHFDDPQKLVLVAMFRVLRMEGAPGSDIVAELEGEARSGKKGLLDTIRENAADIRQMFVTINTDANDFDDAYSALQAMRVLERQGGVATGGPNQAAWREQAANFVRHLIPVFEFVLMGHADRHPEPAAAAAALDVLDRLNVFAGLEPSSAFQRARAIADGAANISRGLGIAFGGLLLYFLVTVTLAYFAPWLLGLWAGFSTWVLLGASAIGIIYGSVKRDATIALGSLFFTLYVATKALTVAWVMATVFGSNVNWLSFWMGFVVSVGMDFISYGILQKVLNAVGGIPEVAFMLMRDRERAKAMAEKVGKGNTFVSISSTIAGAIVMVWFPVAVALICDTPTFLRIGGLALIAVSACIYGYLKRGATMKDYTAYTSAAMRTKIEQQDVQNMDYAYNAVRIIAIVVISAFIAVRAFGIQDLDTGSTRSAHVVSQGGSNILDWAEQQVGAPSGSSRSSHSSSSTSGRKVNGKKTRADLCAEIGGAAECADREASGVATYPCPCD